MSAVTVTRLLEWIFFLYFFTHIPITLLIDLQALQIDIYPSFLKEVLKSYATTYKDAMVLDPPAWFMAFIVIEAFLELPFFPFAAYAFYKGNCRWIRTPAIIYSSHVTTVLLPILSHILFHDFSGSKYPGPKTLSERLTLSAIYFPYFLIPCLILFMMLFNPAYNEVEKRKKK